MMNNVGELSMSRHLINPLSGAAAQHLARRKADYGVVISISALGRDRGPCASSHQ